MADRAAGARSAAPVHLYRRGTWGLPSAETLAAPVGGWVEPLAEG